MTSIIDLTRQSNIWVTPEFMLPMTALQASVLFRQMAWTWTKNLLLHYADAVELFSDGYYRVYYWKLYESYFLSAHEMKQTGMGPRIICLSVPPTQGTWSRMEDIVERNQVDRESHIPGQSWCWAWAWLSLPSRDQLPTRTGFRWLMLLFITIVSFQQSFRHSLRSEGESD